MADIDVVPKHRSNTWVWIVLAIVVAAVLIWAFAGRSHATVGSLRVTPHAIAATFEAAPQRS
jgi:hypothetical protein